MKKQFNKSILLLLLVFSGLNLSNITSVKAQDLVITIQRDTLNCKLGKLNGEFYPIEFKWDEDLMNGMIHKDSILYFKKNMFRSMDDYRLRPWYPTVSFSINVGGGRQFGPLRVGLTDDFNPKKGTSPDRNVFYTGADLIVYLSKQIGYGLKYHYRNMLGGDIQQNYIGPMISFRFWDENRKNHWLLHCSVGYGRMSHNNAMIKIGTNHPESIKLTANALAGDIAVGFNWKLSKHCSSVFKLSATTAYPNFVRIFDYTRINPGGADPLPDISGYCQNMNSVNLSIGFEFH